MSAGDDSRPGVSMLRTFGAPSMALFLLLAISCSDDGTAPEQSGRASTPTASSTKSNEPQGEHVPALIGSWDHEFNRAEGRKILDNFAGLVEGADRVVARLVFKNQIEWWLGFMFDGKLILVDGVPEGDRGTYKIDGDQLVTTGGHGQGLVTYKWALNGQKLTLTALEECAVAAGAEPDCIRDRSAMDPMMLLVTEQTFIRSGDDVTY